MQSSFSFSVWFIFHIFLSCSGGGKSIPRVTSKRLHVSDGIVIACLSLLSLTMYLFFLLLSQLFGFVW